ncbi:DUF1508 domain-containing protein [Devosia neptuniae]|uniref:DUF1508 domain-containing protein n=1 Tax=Devosia neptuniae TaxID=191302 RepID=A0ABY6CEH4_9HYPH|nr:DUF1508 domain-containing protein [Devosia neptuniae]UXN70589.1 DUF1508 domain-containing protein [Devosia neptuniae]
MTDRPYPSFLIYKDNKGEYRWRYQASNAKIIADSGEGYVKKADCERGIELVQGSNSSPVWVTVDAK